MELYRRQQFDFLLHTAVERFVERIVQRNEGAERALARLRQDRNAEGVRLDDFVGAIFEDFLLANPGGACFVLEALASRPAVVPPSGAAPARTMEQVLLSLAKAVFAELFHQKIEAEQLEFGAPLSPAVEAALGRLEDLLFQEWSCTSEYAAAH